MNKGRKKMVVVTLLELLVPNASRAYSRSESINDQAESRLQRFLTPDEKFIMAFNSSKPCPVWRPHAKRSVETIFLARKAKSAKR